MSRGLIIGLVIAALLIFWGIGVNNNLATKTQNVKAQWGDIQSAYQRRSDLIPNLVNTVKGVANFEQGTLVAVQKARSEATQMKISGDDLTPENIAKYQAAQNTLGGALGRLMAVSENYPQLRATQNFSELQAQIEGTENRINVERNKFNEVVRDYNGDLVKFPASFIAKMIGFSEKGYIEAAAGSDKAPVVDFGEAK
jgi:LemA protein